MARNRVIYQSQAVYASQTAYDGDLTATGSVVALNRIQSANYSFSVARQDVNQFGELAAIDRIIIDTPTVSFDTSYYVNGLSNEKAVGFRVTPSGTAMQGNAISCITDIIDSTTTANQKDYFILTTKEGADAALLSESTKTGDYESIIGIGNGFMTSYSTEASVGGLPTASISVEGQNMNFTNLPIGSGDNVSQSLLSLENTLPATGGAGFRLNGRDAVQNKIIDFISGISPAVNATDGTKVNKNVALPVYSGNANAGPTAQISSLRPGDITLSLYAHNASAQIDEDLMNGDPTAQNLVNGADIADSHIQSFNVSFDLSRTPIERLGSRFAFARVVDFPITSSLSVDAVLSDLTSGSIADFINCDDSYDAVIKMKSAGNCNVPADKPVVAAILMRKLKLDSESFTSSIGDNKSVTLDFSNQIGGPEQTDVGIFMSGYSNIDRLVKPNP
tara:strand:+ start:1694 stop:3037 length:1344 start_codon:yes stop_codon:yes gene_type:complete